MKDKPRIYGHRGIMSKGPENTGKAFDAAAKSSNATGYECDVQKTREGIPVVVHEDLGRTTNATDVFPQIKEKKIVAQDLSLDQLKQLDAGEGEKILTVQELATISKSPTKEGARIDVAYEIKTDGVSADVLAAAKDRGPLDHSIFISFEDTKIDPIKAADPEAVVFKLIRPDDPIPDLDELASRGVGLGVRIDGHDPELLDACAEKGIDVLGYSPMIEPETFPRDTKELLRREPAPYGLVLNEPDQLLPEILYKKE